VIVFVVVVMVDIANYIVVVCGCCSDCDGYGGCGHLAVVLILIIVAWL
jgi:hypothetical protein